MKPNLTHISFQVSLRLGAATCIRGYRPTESFAEHLFGTGACSFPVFALDRSLASAATFRSFLQAACESHGSFGACVTLHSVEEYAARDLFIGSDGLTGFAIKNGEVASVFRHAKRPGPSILRNLMALAVQVGGSRLDAYNTNLPERYRSCGFVDVARLPWDDSFTPPGWSFRQFRSFNRGRPDIVFMAYGVSPIPPLMVATYDEGVVCQRLALAFAGVRPTQERNGRISVS